MLHTLAVEGYRSLRNLVLPLGRLTLITGANGAGKSSLYRALSLARAAARGDLARALHEEGGLSSALWAGPERITAAMRRGEAAIEGGPRKDRARLAIGFAGEPFSYSIELGLPIPSGSIFDGDPEIKSEAIWTGPVFRKATTLARRRAMAAWAADENGAMRLVSRETPSFETMLAFGDPRAAPEIVHTRETLRAWRFYDHLRVDRGAPARSAGPLIRTPALAGDGSDLRAALATIREIGDGEALDRAIEDAFPGSALSVWGLPLKQPGLLRPLDAPELSDGTLRYLMLIAALLSPRPPSLIALNEPESSLEAKLLPPLGRLIAKASRSSQTIVVSHAPALIEALENEGAMRLDLFKEWGETRARGIERPRWAWPER